MILCDQVTLWPIISVCSAAPSRRSPCRKPARLPEIPCRLLDRFLLGLVTSRAVAACDPRARVGVGDRTVVHVAQPVALHDDRPACQFQLLAWLFFWVHTLRVFPAPS